MLRGQFEDVLAEFGETVKLPLSLGEDGTATFTVDDEIGLRRNGRARRRRKGAGAAAPQ